MARDEDGIEPGDIVTYNKECIFDLCPVPGIELLNPLEFPK